MLGRLSERRHSAAFLVDALAERPHLLADCIEVGEMEPLPEMDATLSRIVSSWPPAQACAFHNRLPEHTTRLRETGLAVTVACWQVLETRANETPNATRAFAEISNNLVARLAQLGRHKLAAERASELVERIRPLAESVPENLRYLARSVASRAMALGALEQVEESIADYAEAAQILRGLSISINPELDLELGLVLNNLAGQYLAAGRADEALTAAQESVAIHRAYRDRDPGPEREPCRNLANLAAALGVLTNALVARGDFEAANRAAREAADILEPLAEESPARFLHQWAMARTNLAMTAQRLGRLEEAMTTLRPAATVFLQLANTYPEAFLADCASVHRSLAAVHYLLDLRAEALTASDTTFDCVSRATSCGVSGGIGAVQEALSLYLQLEPYQFLEQTGLDRIESMVASLLEQADGEHLTLVDSLIETGKALKDKERFHEALALTRAVVDWMRPLAKEGEHDDAGTLLCSAVVQSLSIQAQLPQPHGARQKADETMTALESLARGGNSARGNAALLFNNLSNALSWLELPEQAIAAARHAVNLLRPLTDRDPEQFEPQLAIALYNLARRLSSRAGDQVAAILAESRHRLAPYLQREPERYGGWMAEIEAFEKRLFDGS